MSYMYSVLLLASHFFEFYPMRTNSMKILGLSSLVSITGRKTRYHLIILQQLIVVICWYQSVKIDKTHTSTSTCNRKVPNISEI